VEPYLISRKSTGDEISKYLDKVFGDFPTPGEVEADQWQEKLGVEVTLDDLDLIYTLQATEEEDTISSGYVTYGNNPRMKTQFFLDAVRDMRVEMSQQLRKSVGDLEAEGSSAFTAIKKTMARAIQADSLREKVIESGIRYCRQKTLEQVTSIDHFALQDKPKYDLSDLLKDIRQLLSPMMVWLIIIFEPAFRNYPFHTFVFSLFGAFLLGLGASSFYRTVILKQELLARAKPFLTRRPKPQATALQRLRFSLFRFSNTPVPLSLGSNFVHATVPFLILGVCLHSTQWHLDSLTLALSMLCGLSVGKRMWCRIRAAKIMQV